MFRAHKAYVEKRDYEFSASIDAARNGINHNGVIRAIAKFLDDKDADKITYSETKYFIGKKLIDLVTQERTVKLFSIKYDCNCEIEYIGDKENPKKTGYYLSVRYLMD